MIVHKVPSSMQKARTTFPTGIRILLCILFLTSLTASAQELQRSGGAYTLPPGSMPTWAVPVLRLVSSTHVEPTTGIVISDNGMVLVPNAFANSGDEIIVLDGGTDIVRNGRPARIERSFSAQGLQVLFVDGLQRNGVTLAAGTPQDGSEIVLTAFPPAEEIAEGKPPLSLTASVVVFEESGNAAISGETRLPNVTGGLVDTCGNLVAVSLADDVQTMESSPATRYQWKQTLLYILGEMQITPREFTCPGPQAEPSPAPEEEIVAEEEIPAEEEQPAQPVPEEAVIDDPLVEEELFEEERVEEDPEPPVDILPPVEQGAYGLEPPKDVEESNHWPWLLAALLLLGLGFALHRLRQSRSPIGDIRQDKDASSAIPVVQEDGEETTLPAPVFDSLLRIKGVLADGTPFEASCPVNERAINVTIGRGETDLIIESHAVSRSHVNLNGTREALTITDLGSSNGTSINGVPCLEGEILYIKPGDSLVLGNARCTLEFTPVESGKRGRP